MHLVVFGIHDRRFGPWHVRARDRESSQSGERAVGRQVIGMGATFTSLYPVVFPMMSVRESFTVDS